MRARRPRSRVGLARNLVAASRHPSTITRLHGAANLPFGIRCHRAKSNAGGTPALPGGSRPKPCRCKQALVHGHALARSGEPALRDSLPWCRVVCGRDARAPGWVSPETLSLQAGTRPRSLPCTVRRTCPAGFVAMVPGRMRARRPRSRVGLARNLVAASRHRSTVTPLHGAANLPFGIRCHGAKWYAGETPALPGGSAPITHASRGGKRRLAGPRSCPCGRAVSLRGPSSSFVFLRGLLLSNTSCPGGRRPAVSFCG